jgi:hypothetical protein
MGAAAMRRGDINLRRPFDEASDTARWLEDSMNMYLAAEKSVERCREINSTLADVASCKGLRYVFAQANLDSCVGQKRRDKYLAACDRWRDQKPGRREWCAAIDMKNAGNRLMEWLGL